MNRQFSLDNRLALVSGGSRGIGLEIVKGFLSAGAEVIFTSRHEKDILEVLKELVTEKAHGFVCDVSRKEDIENLFERIKEIGTVDILVNNAGINIKQPLHELDYENYEKVIKTDLEGPVIMCSKVLPGMMAKRKGKIINICSMMSEYGSELNTAYAVSKGGIKLLTKNIAAEYGRYNIQCNGIGPGYIYTKLNEKLREPDKDGSKNIFERYIDSRIPLGHWGDPKDLAGPAVFLASEASDYVNGQILYVDGGFSSAIGDPSLL
ncbi:MAG: SDR family oxidoreductase [Erysipelotrichaceae bacterium]|nr:SDR family oxidoreductase [Erysipelotrichaceae bacterium]